ncbi:MAG TPA: hypothetical protein VKB86_01080 [Pyrinomonadaceae bacterium]|nr:hypothetical protein [Pyrinomonadaceae bacterium]
MPFKEKSAFCSACNRQVLARKRTPSHVLHLLLTIFTFGLWWVIWLILGVKKAADGWLCTQCGRPAISNSKYESQLLHQQHKDALSGFGQLNSDNSTLKIIGCVFGVLLIIGLIGSLFGRTSNQASATVQSSNPALSSTATQSFKATAQETKQTESKPFQTEEQREAIATLFIKPVLKQMLHDPDSLQDLEITSVIPLKKMPNAYKVSVFYRARNGFGALRAQQQAFILTRGTGDGLDAWNVLPIKD